MLKESNYTKSNIVSRETLTIELFRIVVDTLSYQLITCYGKTLLPKSKICNCIGLPRIRPFSYLFRIDVTLLKWEQFFTEYVYSIIINMSTDVLFMWIGKKGEESKTEERLRKRRCERGRVSVRRGSISCKNDRWRKHTIWDKNRIKAIGLL